jgi:hypothetical protein
MQDEDEQEYGELIELEGQEQDDVEDTEDGGAIVRLDEEDPKAGESEFYANLADGIIPEPLGGAHNDHAAAAASLKDAVLAALAELGQIPTAQLLEQRYQKFRAMGQFTEG